MLEKKGKVNKMYILSHFLLSTLLLGIKRLVFLKPKIVDKCTERSQMSHTPKSTGPSLQRALLEFNLGRLAVTLALAGQNAVFWGVSATLPMALRPERTVKAIQTEHPTP